MNCIVCFPVTYCHIAVDCRCHVAVLIFYSSTSDCVDEYMNISVIKMDIPMFVFNT